MSEARLDSVAEALTARERAHLAIGEWIETGEEPDKRLWEHLAGPEREEFERLVQVVSHANEGFHRLIVAWTEWLMRTELTLGWLQCLAGYTARAAALTGALKAAAVDVVEEGTRGRRRARVVLPALPPPGAGFWADLSSLQARRSDEQPLPRTWTEALGRLRKDVRQGIEFRWMELMATEMVLAELEEEIGCAATHRDVRAGLDRLRTFALKLYREALPSTGKFALPEPSEQVTTTVRAYVDFARLETAKQKQALPAYDPRRYLPAAQKAELESLEAEWAAKVRRTRPASGTGTGRLRP